MKEDGNAQVAEAITENTKSNISYVVNLQIIHFDKNRKAKTIVDQEKVFKDQYAIHARQSAFVYCYNTLDDAEEDGFLCDGHLDSPIEAHFKEMKNVNTLYITIDVINEQTGDRLTISECDFEEPPEEFIEECVTELQWYRDFGYSTDDWETTEEFEDGEWEILNFVM